MGRRRMGIDEAGRGCVLGDLFVAAYVTEADDDALRAAGAADSKAVSAKRREAARSALAALGTASVQRISPLAIDAGNLNTLEEEAIVALIVTLRPDEVWLDALGPPKALPALTARLQAALRPMGIDVPIHGEPKADARFPVVGAASMFAKVGRDEALAEADAVWGPLGSGYPSDPVTRTWLTERLASTAPLPPIVRTRWGTVDALRALHGRGPTTGIG
jgi:ribonuclease HII